ncbi:unnamed protein product [Allacma fusca]|uniref:Uncharacterized protein n=3 Tax=Allacma fusca TaxID=39272 RepID=A0A8J2KX75_9HEXA|nr:unnamed protein product [Allacma fusca]
MKFVTIALLVAALAMVLEARPWREEADLTKRQNNEGSEVNKRQYNGDLRLKKRQSGGILGVGAAPDAECPPGMYRAVDGSCQEAPILFDFD